MKSWINVVLDNDQHRVSKTDKERKEKSIKLAWLANSFLMLILKELWQPAGA